VDRVGEEEATDRRCGITDATELQAALGEFLASCRRLTVDVGKLEVLDATFRVLICSLHR